MMGEEKQANPEVEPGVSLQGITVELSYAAVPAFAQALEVARKHPTFQEFGAGKSLRVRVTYPLDELDALQELKDAVWDLRHKRAWFHGAEMDWYEMAQLTHCFQEFVHKPRRDHCFFDGNFWSGFGCRYAIANFSDRISNEWLTYGRLESGGVWVFDRGRIADYVKQQLYRGYQFCPAFDEEYLERFLELFPERVDVVEDDDWRLLKNRQGETIGVAPREAGSAKKIVYQLQEKVRQRRGPDKVQENGKRKLPAALFKAYQPPPKKKKGLLARLLD